MRGGRSVCQSPSHRGTHFYDDMLDEDDPFAGCQSPSHRGTHFYYRIKSVTTGLFHMCQSPSHRGTHFYNHLRRCREQREDCVNPLLIGELISTYCKDTSQSRKWIVSIPFSSGNSFLLCCTKDAQNEIQGCVNPLLIGELISTLIFKYLIHKFLCQSPSHRGTHFYIKYFNKSFEPAMCQSPSHRGTHFYADTKSGKKRVQKCVNPLLIGELISTVLLMEKKYYELCVSIPFSSGNSFLQEGEIA